MNLPVIFRPEAEEDVQEIYQWYESQQPGLGEEFIRILREKLDIVRDHRNYLRLFTKMFAGSFSRSFPILFSTSAQEIKS